MHVEEKMSYRKITKFLNRSGIKTATGKTWHATGSSVYSVLKRMKERQHRLNNVRGAKFESQITDFKVQKLGGKK
jgi:hypothetical protein